MVSYFLNKKNFINIPAFSITGIGSLPHLNAEEACSFVLDNTDIPFWPQLPRLSFFELMIPQFSEGLPFLKVDEERQNIWIEDDGSNSLNEFYERYSDGIMTSISERNSKGFYAFLKSIKGMHFDFLKGQTTGPLTFTLGLKDKKGRPIYFDEELREVSLLLLKSKIRWQINILREYANNVIVFIDEPILSALGTSSYLGVDTEEVIRLLRETSDEIKQSNCISGIHCCAKADWQIVIESGVDIISFDAYEYAQTLSIYPDEFNDFLKRGGYLAWGIVPTTDAIIKESTESLKEHFNLSLERLSKYLPYSLLIKQIIMTPSCGLGSRSIEDSTKVFRILRELKNLLHRYL